MESYKDRYLESEGEVHRLKIQLQSKEQIISCLYNLIKDIIFWNKQ